MAFSFGGGINPQLGAQDFSAILRGAQNYSQSTAAGSAAIGQGIGSALAGLGEGLKLYKQNQEKSQMMLGELQNIIRNDESAIKDVDPKILKQVESGDIRFKDLSQAYANVMTGQKMKAARQAAQDQKSIAVGLSALRYGNDPLAAVQGTGNTVTPGVVNFFSQLSTMQAEREKTQAETAKLRAEAAGSPLDALREQQIRLGNLKTQAEIDALKNKEQDKFNATLTDITRAKEAELGRPLTANEKVSARQQAASVLTPPTQAIPGYQTVVTPGGGWGAVPIQGAPASTEQQKLDQQKVDRENAKVGLSDAIGTSIGSYLALDAMGAAVNPSKSIMENVKARVSASDIGQMVGGAAGTEAQSYRDTIGNITPLLIQQIKKATGMTGTELNSNQELQFWVKMAGDTKRDIVSNLVALDVIDSRFGGGNTIDRLLADNPDLLRRVKARSAREYATKRIAVPSADVFSKADAILGEK